ncbi:RNase adapter RapZ, partial [Myxococcota bacterium]|nr:RNase adapter RapZ [Myxococcota bacterium]
VSLRLIYLEAAEEILIRRYSETRRRHPADEGQGVRAAVHDEKKSLQGLRELADQVIDTSQLSPHQLRAFFIEDVAGNKPGADLRIVVQSFGFKYGILLEADIVSDVRFLKNPYFIPELREFSGKDSQVRDFVLGNPDTQEFLEHSSHTLDFLIPRYKKEGKRYLTVGIGCTGGRHRSVAIAIEQAERLKKLGWDVVVNHRDLVEGKI